MKTYALFTIVYCLSFSPSCGKIINGYEKHIQSARSSYQQLTSLPADRRITERLMSVREYILYYELTRKLLMQFKAISPSLYQEIDTISDYKGRPVDIYVKFVPQTGIGTATIATTNINQLSNDKHGYLSEYGEHTVSIKVTTVKHALSILAHEFGHAGYQVKNLAAYVDFFSTHYRDHQMKADYLGHKPNDPSGQRAEAFEKRFRNESLEFIKRKSNPLQHPALLRNDIQKTLK